MIIIITIIIILYVYIYICIYIYMCIYIYIYGGGAVKEQKRRCLDNLSLHPCTHHRAAPSDGRGSLQVVPSDHDLARI